MRTETCRRALLGAVAALSLLATGCASLTYSSPRALDGVEVKDGGDGEPVPFRHADGNVRLAIVYKDGEVSLFVDGAEKAVLESDACAKFLRRVKEGKFRFNGAGVRLLSMKVMRP